MRPNRIDLPDYPYHVFNRGNNKAVLFRNNEDRSRFLGILRSARKRFDFLMHSWCLMDNHFHFLIQTLKDTRLSELMHWVQLGYARYFQSRYGHIGHVFQSRYKGILVQKDRYFMAVDRYIHWNAPKAGLVQKPEDYVWSSYRLRLRGADDGLTQHDAVLDYFGRDPILRLKQYREFTNEVAGRPPEWSDKTLEKMIVHGTADFLAKVRLECAVRPGLMLH